MSLWDQIIKFNDEYFPGWRDNRELIFFSNALAGEVGEICNKVKKLYGGGTNNNSPSSTDMIFEAVDVYIYLVLFLEALEVDENIFCSAFAEKMRINKERMIQRSMSTEDTSSLRSEA